VSRPSATASRSATRGGGRGKPLIAVERVKRKNSVAAKGWIATITAIWPVVAERGRRIESSSAAASSGWSVGSGQKPLLTTSPGRLVGREADETPDRTQMIPPITSAETGAGKRRSGKSGPEQQPVGVAGWLATAAVSSSASARG